MKFIIKPLFKDSGVGVEIFTFGESEVPKYPFIAEEIIKTKQGIINEKVIYENELKRLMEEDDKEQIRIMEDFFNNKKCQIVYYRQTQTFLHINQLCDCSFFV